jgi:hypothetical protein
MPEAARPPAVVAAEHAPAVALAESEIAEQLAPLAPLTTPERFKTLVHEMALDWLRPDLPQQTFEHLKRKYAHLPAVAHGAAGRNCTPGSGAGDPQPSEGNIEGEAHEESRSSDFGSRPERAGELWTLRCFEEETMERGRTDQGANREARLRPAYDNLYPGITPEVWEPAATTADRVLARRLEEGTAVALMRDRALSPEHFEFRGRGEKADPRRPKRATDSVGLDSPSPD